MAHKRPGKALSSVEPVQSEVTGSSPEDESKPPLRDVSRGTTSHGLDVLIAVAFLAVALFARLYNISDPAGIVFDEVHFNKVCGLRFPVGHRYHMGMMGSI